MPPRRSSRSRAPCTRRAIRNCRPGRHAHDRGSVNRILVIKTAALGDVLRTTSILPGLHQRHPGTAVTWVTAPAAVPLVVHHPLVHEVLAVEPRDADAVDGLAARLAAVAWLRVLS